MPPPKVKGTAQAAASTSVTIPTHAPGDMIVIAAYRDGNTTIPTKPAASGTVPAWVDITAATGANTNAMRTAYFIATASNHTSGTWTNATGMMAIVIVNQRLSSPVGGSAEGGSTNANNVTVPALSSPDLSGSALFLMFMGHRTVTAWSAAPSGYTSQANVATECQIGTKDSSTADGSIAWGVTTSNNSGYRAVQMWIMPNTPRSPAINYQNPAIV